MRWQDIPLDTPIATSTAIPVPAPPTAPPEPGPAPPTAPPESTAPVHAQATLPRGVRLPAGLEPASALALAELAELPANGPWAELPIPFALIWLCARHVVFSTWHAVTYAHLRRAKVATLHPTEWSALLLGAQNDRSSHVTAQWIQRKINNPLFELTNDLCLGGVVADSPTRTFTIAQLGGVWSLSLIGAAYGPG